MAYSSALHVLHYCKTSSTQPQLHKKLDVSIMEMGWFSSSSDRRKKVHCWTEYQHTRFTIIRSSRYVGIQSNSTPCFYLYLQVLEYYSNTRRQSCRTNFQLITAFHLLPSRSIRMFACSFALGNSVHSARWQVVAAVALSHYGVHILLTSPSPVSCVLYSFRRS